jgi:toxin ParE1/3/4
MVNIYKQAQAKQDLVDVWLYTFYEWGEAQADKYLDGLESALWLLAEQPLICRERNELEPPVRIYHHQHHMVVYLVVGDGINIIRVLHKNMDAKEQLEQ